MDRLEEISNGFMEAKILLAAAHLSLFDHLAGGPKTAEQVARAIGGSPGSPRPVEMLLDALVAIGIVDKEEGRYQNRPEYEPFLLDASETHYIGILRHRNRLFRRWAYLEEKLLGAPLPIADDPREGLTDRAANENFIRAMYAVSHRQVGAVADQIDLAGVGSIADVGGGPGHYLAELGRRAPSAELYLVDLPLTLEVARKILAGADAAARIHLVAWDFYEEPRPEGLPAFDLLFLSQVVHAEDDASNRALFAKLAAITAPGGRIVVHERTVEEDRSRPYEGAIFAINMLAMTEGGATYTAGEIEAWGRAVGLVPEGAVRLSGRSELITLRKP